MEKPKDSAESAKVHNIDGSLMAILDECEEMEIFDTVAIKEIIQYKWDNFAKSWHLVGAFFHLFYIVSLSVYIFEVYVLADYKDVRHWLILLACGVAYPLIYEII